MPEFVKIYVAAGVVVKQDGKYLLVQEKKPSAYGLWNLPAGRVEEGDSIEKTAVKEAKEETGFEVELIRELGVFHEDVKVACKHAFEAKIIGGELNIPEDEILDVRWFTYEEVLQMKDKLRTPTILQAIDIIEKRK
ncbi:MAG: NUDIX domain-containing protein [Patescibacteria group bacterium]|jgi:ADP-ribose pyrophosphatase YjhB (NUDIX family)